MQGFLLEIFVNFYFSIQVIVVKTRIFIFRFISDFFLTETYDHKSYLKLFNEIKRCKPVADILNAYINQKNILVIKTSSQKDADYLSEDWLTDAFTYGIRPFEDKSRFFVALSNVNLDLDLEDEDLKSFLLTEYKITNLNRLIKRSTNQKLHVVKAEISDFTSFKKIITTGKLKIGFTNIKASAWKSDPLKPLQCFKCQAFNHTQSDCTSANPKCMKCSGAHNFRECKSNKLKCANCGFAHASCRRAC